MIVLVALFFSLAAIFYSLEAFERAKTYYIYTLRLALKQELIDEDSFLIPKLILKAKNTYIQNPYKPYYEEKLEKNHIHIKIVVKDDENLNINSIKDKNYYEVFHRLSENFCMPKDFDKYIYYWISGKNLGIKEESLSYPPPFQNMASKQELIYATPYNNRFLYQNNCHKKTKGIWYVLDTKNEGLNINTVKLPILKSLNKDITDDIAREIINYRNAHTIKNLQDLVNIRGLSLDDVYKIEKLLSTSSKTLIILLKSSTQKGGVKENLTTKIYYSPIQNKILGISWY